MTSHPTLEGVLYDIQAEMRVLYLLAENEEDESAWSIYGLPPEDGFDLKRLPCCDSLATWLTILRLKKLADLAVSTFRART